MRCRYLDASSISAIAMGFSAPWERVANVATWIVGLFGFLLCLTCLVAVFGVGMRAMSTGRYNRAKHKRG
jgi:hypothetical protein